MVSLLDRRLFSFLHYDLLGVRVSAGNMEARLRVPHLLVGAARHNLHALAFIDRDDAARERIFAVAEGKAGLRVSLQGTLTGSK